MVHFVQNVFNLQSPSLANKTENADQQIAVIPATEKGRISHTPTFMAESRFFRAPCLFSNQKAAMALPFSNLFTH